MKAHLPNIEVSFTNLFTCLSISMNVSSEGPVMVGADPFDCFDRTILENLGVRALLAAGIGDNLYHDRIFSSRITLPKMKDRAYEALIFNFVINESSTNKLNKISSKSLALLIFSYPRKLRKYVAIIENDLEDYLKHSLTIPTTSQQLLDPKERGYFIEDLQSSILLLETEFLLGKSDITLDNWIMSTPDNVEYVPNG